MDAIPDELIVLDPLLYARFVAAFAAVRAANDVFMRRATFELRLLNEERHPIAIIHYALSQCRDEASSPETPALAFLASATLSQTLRFDMTGARTALGNGEWKAATVLAGSVIEALLLWAITRHPQPDWEAAMQAAVGAGHKVSGSKANPRDWHLPDYIEVAGELGCITTGTREEARRTRAYRNLIHPGAAERTGQQCDLGTGHIAVGTLDHVIRDLEKRGDKGACP